MNNRRPGLGRGLGSLIPTAPEGAASATAGPAAPASGVPTRRLPLGEVYRPDLDDGLAGRRCST